MASNGRLFVLVVGVLALIAGLTVAPQPARAQVQPATETPVIELDPYCWTSSGVQTVTISGHSFQPNVKINVFDSDNGQTFTTATTDDFGTFTARLNVSVSSSGNEIRATDASGEEDLAFAVFRYCDYGGPVKAKIVPACSDDEVPSIHLVGSGWAAAPDNATILFNLFGGGSLLTSIEIPAAASFDFSWSPDISWESPDYNVDIWQNGYDGEEQVVENYTSVRFRLGCPAVTVTPACSQTGGPPARVTMTLSGGGFDPALDLHLIFDEGGKPQDFVYQFPVPPSPDPYATGETPPPPDGTFGPISINPFARPDGSYTLELLQRDQYGTVVRDWITTFAVPCFVANPTLTAADPTCGPAATPGDSSQVYAVTVAGTGFEPHQPITIVFDPDYAAGSEYPPEAFTGSTDSGGGLYAAINPRYRPAGTYRILAYQDTSFGHYEASTSFSVPCAAPPTASLSVIPTCQPAADGQPAAYSLSLTGAGFLPGPVTVVLDPAGVPFSGTVEADASGYFVAVSFVTDGKPPGSYQVVAYQDNSGEHLEGVATLTVPCLTLTIDPTCAAPAEGQPSAYGITATGVGFAPGSVDLVFDPAGLAPFETQVLADAGGAFSAPLVLDGKPPGVYDLVASQSSSYGLFAQASTQLLVPCDLVLLRITPTSGPRGFVPNVEGFGLAPLAKLTLRWDFGIGTSQPMAIETDANGYFSRQVMIFQHDFLGPRHLTVQNPDDPTAYTDLIAPYLVAAAPIQPPFSADETFGPPSDPVILQR